MDYNLKFHLYISVLTDVTQYSWMNGYQFAAFEGLYKHTEPQGVLFWDSRSRQQNIDITLSVSSNILFGSDMSCLKNSLAFAV